MKYVPGIKDTEKIVLKSQCNLIWSSQNGGKGEVRPKIHKSIGFFLVWQFENHCRSQLMENE